MTSMENMAVVDKIPCVTEPYSDVTRQPGMIAVQRKSGCT